MLFASSFRHVLSIATLLFAAASASAASLPPETPDTHPDLGLERSNGAAGLRAGAVHAIAPHPRGGVIVGGEFIRARGNVELTHLVRLRADGTRDPEFRVELASSGSVYVNAIATTRDAIYIGGVWDTVNGVERPVIAKLDLDGNLVTEWHQATPQTEANLLHDYDIVNAIAVAGDDVFVGGNLQTLRLMGLAKLDATTGAIDPDWRAQTQTHDHAGAPDMGWRGEVHALLYTGTDLIVGGNFAQIGRVGRNGVARVATAATPGGQAVVAPYVVEGFAYAGIVSSLAYDRTRNQIYVGGRYFVSGGVHDNLIRTDARTGAVDATWTPNPGSEVSAIALAHGHVYYGGDFGTQVGDDPFLVRTSRTGDGSTDPRWLPMPDRPVLALLWQGGVERLWIGGEFITVDGRARNGLARLSWDDDPHLMFKDGLED